jgi:ankyrin repeat protein
MKEDRVAVFCRALWRGDKDEVERLAPVVDPNGSDRWGPTPLSMAVQYGDLPLVSLLVRRGADVNQGKTFLTPVTFAARRGELSLVEHLRKAGAAASIVTWTYLGEHDLLLLDHGVNIDSTDATGETPLHRVADIRRASGGATGKMATLLLDRGADPNARNWDDVTPLHQAVRARNIAVVEVLLARGADPNARDGSHGSTPLRRAVSGTGAGGTAGTTDLMVPLTRLLLRYGADPDMRDKRGVPVHKSARLAAVKAVIEEHRRENRASRPTDRSQPPRPRSGTVRKRGRQGGKKR